MSATANLSQPAISQLEGMRAEKSSRRFRIVRILWAGRVNRIALLILAIAILACFVPLSWLPHDPTKGSLTLRFQPPAWVEGGDWSYPLGTDALGRDILSRLVYGSRYTLLITFLSVPIAAFVGTLLGVISGYHGGRLDAVIMRIVDIQLAFPTILLLIAIIGSFGSSLWILVSVLALAGWVRYTRVVRGSVLSVREREFVEASRTSGAGNSRILIRHVLPNVLSPLVVLISFEFARTLLLESTLSFLGVGIQPPHASWGSMIADGRNYLVDAWWVSLMPGVAIVLTVVAFNFLGDGLRDALDPQSRIM